MKALLSSLALTASVGLFAAPAALFASDCCAGGCGTLSADAARGEMAQGGADATTVPVGYGLGYKTPNFTLSDTTGKEHSLADYEGKIVVLTFYNQSCPYVVEMWDRMDDFAERYEGTDVVFLAVDPGVENTEEQITAHAEERSFPILLNRTSELAMEFEATRTPEVFLHDRDGVVVYHGMFDNGRQGAAEGARRSYAEDAVKALLEDREIAVTETRAFGCTIKWHPDTRAEMERRRSEAAEAGGS